jgi:hypothetical protein
MILRINSKFRLPAAAPFLCDKPRKAAAACLLALGACTAQVAEFPAVFEAPGFGPADIDLDDYELSFEEQFDGRLDVSDWRCDTKWIAHTPWAGDYGGAAFANPRRRFPFLVKDGLLRIEAKKDSRGEWRAGMLSAGNSCGEGKDSGRRSGSSDGTIKKQTTPPKSTLSNTTDTSPILLHQRSTYTLQTTA